MPTIKTEQYHPVNKPVHYNVHPSGIECIQVVEHMGFCLGNAIKYIWRADHKGDIEDLEKAIWYVQREITKRRSKLALQGPGGQSAQAFSLAEQAQMRNASTFINTLAQQGGQLKGDFESFKEYINETGTGYQGTENVKGR